MNAAVTFFNWQKCNLKFCISILLYSKLKLKRFVSGRTGLELCWYCIARWQHSHFFEKNYSYLYSLAALLQLNGMVLFWNVLPENVWITNTSENLIISFRCLNWRFILWPYREWVWNVVLTHLSKRIKIWLCACISSNRLMFSLFSLKSCFTLSYTRFHLCENFVSWNNLQACLDDTQNYFPSVTEQNTYSKKSFWMSNQLLLSSIPSLTNLLKHNPTASFLAL